jgi:hypothetical protein
VELRGATEAAVRESRRRRHEYLLDDARARRMRVPPPVRSAWSDLQWRRPEADLHQVLVPVPEER